MEDFKDARNNKAKGVGKHGYSMKEQKRIDELKLKRATQSEEQISGGAKPSNKKTTEAKPDEEEIKVDPFFGVRKTKKVRVKMQEENSSEDY